MYPVILVFNSLLSGLHSHCNLEQLLTFDKMVTMSTVPYFFLLFPAPSVSFQDFLQGFIIFYYVKKIFFNVFIYF